jgi:Tfp pilus assembly protein PilV
MSIPASVRTSGSGARGSSLAGTSMIEMLGVMVVVLVFVGMAAVSAVRTKTIEADAHARFYSAILQTYMTEYGRKQQSNVPWQNAVAAYAGAADDTAKRTALKNLMSLFGAVNDPVMGTSASDSPIIKALDGYSITFTSSPLSPFVVSRGAVQVYPIE